MSVQTVVLLTVPGLTCLVLTGLEILYQHVMRSSGGRWLRQ